MKKILAVLVSITSINARATICEVFIRTTETDTTFVESTCTNGESSSIKYQSIHDAKRDYSLFLKNWSNIWDLVSCNNKTAEQSDSCTFKKRAQVVITPEPKPPYSTDPSSKSQCEMIQIQQVEKAKGDFAKAAITGLGAGALGGAMLGGQLLLATMPSITTGLFLEKGGTFNPWPYVIIPAVAGGTILMVGFGGPKWFEYLSKDKLASSNLVFFRDIRSDGIGPEFDIRALMILQTLKEKKFYFTRDWSLIDKLFAEKNTKEKVSQTLARMRVIPTPAEVLDIQNIRAELKKVGTEFLAHESALRCLDPRDVYTNLSVLVINRLLDKYF
ncbi:MAG: hypothetical protein ACK5V3_07420 [Bdellovibrionales bacterium]